MELNKIYNEDCMEGMKRIPDASIDLIVTDPPYNTTDCEWDKNVLISKKLRGGVFEGFEANGDYLHIRAIPILICCWLCFWRHISSQMGVGKG